MRGLRERLGIADALVKEPPMLILDEPTTPSDPIGVGEIFDLIWGLARERGIAILLASDLLDQVPTVCHRVGVRRPHRAGGRSGPVPRRGW